MQNLSKSIAFLRVVGQLLFLYGLLGWIYGVLIQLHHSASLTYPLSHLTPWIRVDTFTIMSFLVSAAGFLIWRTLAELVRSAQEPNWTKLLFVTVYARSPLTDLPKRQSENWLRSEHALFFWDFRFFSCGENFLSLVLLQDISNVNVLTASEPSGTFAEE